MRSPTPRRVPAPFALATLALIAAVGILAFTVINAAPDIADPGLLGILVPCLLVVAAWVALHRRCTAGAREANEDLLISPWWP